MKEAERWQARIIPVDSEPSAIFQCLAGVKPGGYDAVLSRVFLTASGGPFYAHKGSLDKVAPAQALKHPRWSMGPKITVDSSTLMNKGLEAIEIQNLFGLPISKVQVLIHPQSVVHSGVEFKDGSVLAQLSWPDMKLPIQYALTWPDRAPSLAEPLGGKVHSRETAVHRHSRDGREDPGGLPRRRGPDHLRRGRRGRRVGQAEGRRHSFPYR